MSHRQECKECGCSKSEHTKSQCKSCLIIYMDNYKEYQQAYKENHESYVSPWHSFKLDNLKYLEQIYESKRR